ncbi:MAG: TlpA disulfide reductase family protein [Bacteroidia bacterium]|nr:TlpA disulfide reductase family protein [Bacteroidia bacterium]
MKKNIPLLLLLCLLIIVSCSEKADYGQPDVNVESLQKDFMKWWTYYYERIDLSSNFTAVDTLSNKISKAVFLQSLTTGKYIPVKLTSKDTSVVCYKLFQLNQKDDNRTGETIKNASIEEYERFKMEGQQFPKFNYADLNGKQYTNENTKGKFVVLKCWFIRCTTCVAEFPELNEMVNQYKDRKDVVFVSLAWDNAADLKEFLLKKPFNYATVSVQKSYFRDTLNVNSFPIHYLIDKEGKIVKIVSTAKRLKVILANATKIN